MTKKECKMVEKIKRIIEACPLFDNTDSDYIRKLGSVVSYRAGNIIADENGFRRALGLVLSGRAVAENSGGNKTARLNEFESGDIFGAATLFEEADFRYMSTIRAKKITEIMWFSEQAVVRLITEKPAFALNYAKYLTGKIRFLNGKISGYTGKNAEKCLEEYVKYNCEKSPEGMCDGNVSRLAKELCVSRPTLYSALNSLIDKEIIVREDECLYMKANKKNEGE